MHSHHVVVESCAGHGDCLERLQHTHCTHDGIGGRNGGDDVLHNTLSQLVRYTLHEAGRGGGRGKQRGGGEGSKKGGGGGGW